MGAAYIHGGVEAGDEEEDDTREGIIKRFHDDPAAAVLVANPAAASEGISLHTVCHHAIFLDRTFNAAHYLQAEDRIHRIGLPPGQDTTIEIVECESSIDQSVRHRLELKIGRMADALSDSTLRVDRFVTFEPIEGQDLEDFNLGLQLDDIASLVEDLEQDA